MTQLSLDVLTTYNPCFVTPDTSLAAARNLMDQYSLRHLPVVDAQRRLVGIVSEVDLAQVSAPPAALATVGGAGDDLMPAQDDGHVENVMTEPVVVITPGDSALQAVRMMLEHRFHSLPVVQQQQLVGVVTSSDFLREFTYGAIPGYRSAVRQYAEQWFAQIDDTATLHEAGTIMEGTGLDYLAVVQGDLPIGVISRRVLDVARGAHAADVTNFDSHRPITPWVNTDVPTLRSDATLGRAASAMLDRKVPAVTIVNRRQALVGLLPQDAILQVIAEQLA